MNNILEQLQSDILAQCHDVNGRFRTIPLTQGKVAIVDAGDYDRLACHKWHAKRVGDSFYAARSEGRTMIFMHREILNAPDGLVCDHKNHDALDNRRSNLRICTQAENCRNSRPRKGGTSQYKGVSWHNKAHKWRASICYDGVNKHIGYYDYEQDAAIAYDDMAIELFGEFACLNLHYRPEIRDWLRRTYFFDNTVNRIAEFDDFAIDLPGESSLCAAATGSSDVEQAACKEDIF